MVKALDSHMANYSSSLEPSGLKLTQGVCMHAFLPKFMSGEWRRDCGMALALGGDFSFSLSVSFYFSDEPMCAMAKIFVKQTKKLYRNSNIWKITNKHIISISS